MRGNGSRPSFPAAPPGPPSRAPSRTGLPPIAPPPRRVASNPPHAPPHRGYEAPYDDLAQTVTGVASPALAPNAQPTRKGDSRAEVDLDWSDEEESTSVYAGAREDQEVAQPPRGPYDMPSVIAPQAPMSAPSLREPSSQIAHRPGVDMRRPSSDPHPGAMRETTRGARIVPPALLSSGGTAGPGPAMPVARPYEEVRSRSVTEALPPQGDPGYAQMNAYGHSGAVDAPLPGPPAMPTQQQQHAAVQAAMQVAQSTMPSAAQQPATSASTSHRYRSEMPGPTSPSFRPPAALPIVPLAAPAQDPPRRAGLFIAAAAAVIVALVSVFFLLRRPGELVVDVRDPKGQALPRAEIFVDGRKVCDSTPCIVPDLEAGPRLIKATSPGFQTANPTTVQVEGGRRGEVVVTLAPSTGILIAKGDQPGVKVYIDGVDRGALPTKLEDLPPGARDVRFDGGERYKSLEKVIDLKAGETTDLGGVRLDVLRGQITIELASEDARVTIQKDQEGANAKVVAGPFPKTIELDGSAKWRVVSTKRGLPDYVARFDFTDGVAVKTVRIAMEPEKVAEPEKVTAEPAPSPVAAATPTPAPSPKSGSPAPPPEKKEPEKKEPPPVAAGGNGSVNINSIPVSRVLVDGSPMGETPLSGVSLPAGLHTVTFIHPELGRKSVVVKVEPGKTATASAKLRD